MNRTPNFTDLGIMASLTEQLATHDITTPTPIQQIAIERILKGESLVVKSQTGSGKSLAYILPLLQRIVSQRSGTTQALILLPTRELARQVGEVCIEYSSLLNLSTAVIYGGVEYEPQRETLRSNPDIIIATVGRLQDLIEQGVAQIEQVDFFILDEVDQMVDMGFRDSIYSLAKLRSHTAQTLCFSATVSEEAREILHNVVGDVESIECEGQTLAAGSIEQLAYYVDPNFRDQLTIHLLRKYITDSQTRGRSPRTIIFCRSRSMADRLCKVLTEANFAAEAMHSDRSQTAREYIVERFKSGETTTIVATDLMARGIDVEGVELILNYGLPQSPDQYVHRIGRTGRAVNNKQYLQSRAISLLTPDEKPLLDATCKHMRQAIAASTDHPFTTATLTRALTFEPKNPKKGKPKRRR